MMSGDAGRSEDARPSSGAEPRPPGYEARAPLADVVAETVRLVGMIRSAAVPAGVVGGAAVGLHAHRALPAALTRAYADIDLVVGSGRDVDLRRVLVAAGYEPDRKFNALYGHKRQLFWDRENARQLDVFVGRFAMCHVLPLDGRLDDPSGTLRPADLLLTKLQVVELNSKDVVDALALIDAHEVALDADGDVIGVDRIAEVTAGDWGWFTTAAGTLDRLERSADEMAGDRGPDLRARIGRIREAMEAAPKSLRWRARARIGRRLPWYELPEEHVR
jgi:hypothetical protein